MQTYLIISLVLNWYLIGLSVTLISVGLFNRGTLEDLIHDNTTGEFRNKLLFTVGLLGVITLFIFIYDVIRHHTEYYK